MIVLGINLLLAVAAPGSQGSPANPTSAAQPPLVTTATSAPDDGAPAVDSPIPSARELDDFAQLITGNNTPEARELGARSLLRHGTDEAARRLVAILRSQNDAQGKLAICRAILSSDAPNPMLLDPLVQLVGRNPPELSDIAASSLRRFSPSDVIPRLHALSADGQQPLSRRTAAIAALGSISDDLLAMTKLIELVRDGDAAIRPAVLEAVSEAAGTRLTDAGAAIQWWSGYKEVEPLDWLREMNQRRKEDIRRIRTERDALVQRLVATLRESYLLTSESEQPARLLAFLRDDSAAVRGLALDLINGLITDRREINQDVRRQLLRLVSDSNPTIRRRTAGIVGDLRPAGGGERLREALTVELDPSVRAAQVNALGRLDDAEALGVLIARLNDPSRLVVSEAATALGRLTRRGAMDPAVVESVVAALSDGLQRVPIEDEDLRVLFIEAMGRIGAEEFRAIFAREIDELKSTRVRSAAITALSALPDSAAQIRVLVTATEPEIRLAGVQALGRCGRGREDLDALATCLNAAQEPNTAVRERAWESYLTIVKRLPVKDQLDAAQRFDRPNDAPAQRRRADLLLIINSANDRAEPLTPSQRLTLHDSLASALSALGERAAEARALEDAVAVAAESRPEALPALRRRLIAALLSAGSDQAAADQLHAIATPADMPDADRAALAEIISREITGRIAEADLAADYAKIFDLLRIMRLAAANTLPDLSAMLAAHQQAAVESRQNIVNRLIDALSSDVEADAKLRAFGRETVLPEIAARLSKDGASRPSVAVEARMIEIAKELAPEWPGYAAGAPDSDRRVAIKALSDIVPNTNGAQPPQ